MQYRLYKHMYIIPKARLCLICDLRSRVLVTLIILQADQFMWKGKKGSTKCQQH